MRLFHVALACIVTIAGATDAQADIVRTGSSGVSPATAGLAISWKMVPLPGDTLRGSGLEGPAAGFGTSASRPQAPENEIRLAQAATPGSSGNPAVAPLKWVGLLVNPTPTPANPNLTETCTGQFIKPNVVLTAGHCIRNIAEHQTGPWYDLSKQYFILQYQNGEGSKTFKTLCAATSPQWTLPSNYSSMSESRQQIALLTAYQHDIAMILVDGDSPTGAMPYQLDWKGKWTSATRVGYTTDLLDDRIIQKAPGIVFFADSIPMFPELFPNLVVQWQADTALTYGSSGGGWIANPSSTEAPGSNFLIAVSSFNNTDYPGGEGAAYLTAAEFNPLLAFVSNGCK